MTPRNRDDDYALLRAGQTPSGIRQSADTPEYNTNTTIMDQHALRKVDTLHGEVIQDMNTARCMAVIRALNAEVKDLQDTGIDSVFIAQQIADRGAALSAVIAQLDTFAKAE